MRFFLALLATCLLPVLASAQPSPAPVSSYVRPGLIKTNEADFKSYFGITGSTNLTNVNLYGVTTIDAAGNITANGLIYAEAGAVFNGLTANRLLITDGTKTVASAALLSTIGQGISLINASNAVGMVLKSLTNSGSITLTDNGTNIVVGGGGGGGGSSMTTNVALTYTVATNVLIDFNAAPCYGTNSQGDYTLALTTNSFIIFTNIPGGATNWIANLQIRQHASSSFTVTYKTNSCFFPSGVSPTMTATANSVDVITAIKSINLTNMNATYAQDFR